MNKKNLKFGLVALAGLGLSANVSAADFTCSDITFTPEAFAAYEYADKACLDMIDRDGVTYAKFTATKVVPPDISQGVSTFLRFQHADGTAGPRHKSALPRGYQVMLDGKPIRLADINEGQAVNIYVGSEFWVAPEAEVAEVVAMAEEEVVEEVEEVVEEVMEEPVEEEMPPVLPKTAGPLPWLALFGSLFLILGGALRFARRQ